MSEQRPVAIVTGAASNIGLACAQRFAATHTVIMADIADATQQAASLPHAVAVRVNVGEFDSCLNLVAEARKYGRIDAVVHSAGITRPACSILDMPVEEWENVIKVNLTGAFFLAKACIPPMLEAGQGAMVLFSSRAAKTGFAALGSNGAKTKAHYCASKAGVISLVKSLAMELAPYGIRVNGVAPGPVQGTMIPKESWPVIAEKVPAASRVHYWAHPGHKRRHPHGLAARRAPLGRSTGHTPKRIQVRSRFLRRADTPLARKKSGPFVFQSWGRSSHMQIHIPLSSLER